MKKAIVAAAVFCAAIGGKVLLHGGSYALGYLGAHAAIDYTKQASVVAEMKAKLPMKVDEVTTLVDVGLSGRKATYTYTVSADTNGADFGALKKNLCSNWTSNNLGKSFDEVMYIYNDLNGDRVYSAKVSTSSCQFI